MYNKKAMQDNWEESFQHQLEAKAYNTAAVEALVRNCAYYLRDVRPDGNYAGMRFLEMGSGAGPNLLWLASRGIRVSGVDISPTANELCKRTFAHAGMEHQLENLVEASVDQVPLEDEQFHGIFESCVFQHLDKPTRAKAFAEVKRLLKPGGVFCGYMLGQGHTVYTMKMKAELADDPGTLILAEGKSRFFLTDIGLSHFFAGEEFQEYFPGFSIVDPCLVEYDLPGFEARKRGYDQYRQSMWAVYAVK